MFARVRPFGLVIPAAPRKTRPRKKDLPTPTLIWDIEWVRQSMFSATDCQVRSCPVLVPIRVAPGRTGGLCVLAHNSQFPGCFSRQENIRGGPVRKLRQVASCDRQTMCLDDFSTR